MKLVYQLSDGAEVLADSTQLAIVEGADSVQEAMDKIQAVVPEACMGQQFDFEGPSAPKWMQQAPVRHF